VNLGRLGEELISLRHERLDDVAMEMSIATSLVVRTGNIYAGLAFPIVVALVTVVVGSLLLKDQHNESIWAEVQAGANPRVNTAKA